jgi:hypothetical protein
MGYILGQTIVYLMAHQCTPIFFLNFWYLSPQNDHGLIMAHHIYFVQIDEKRCRTSNKINVAADFEYRTLFSRNSHKYIR